MKGWERETYVEIMEKILRDKGGGGEESSGRNSHNYTWSVVNIALNKCGAAWLKSWNSVVDASDLKMLQYYYENSAPFFKNFFVYVHL